MIYDGVNLKIFQTRHAMVQDVLATVKLASLKYSQVLKENCSLITKDIAVSIHILGLLRGFVHQLLPTEHETKKVKGKGSPRVVE